MKRLLYILILCMGILFIGSCDTISGKDGPKFTIKVLEMTNGTDNDNDGYYSSLRLYFDVDVDESGEKEIYVKIYYRMTGTETYTLFFTSVTYFIDGSVSDDEQYIILDGFSHAEYDFKVEVFQAEKESVEASQEAIQLPLETDLQDLLPISIFSINWSNSVDVDGDNYTTSRRMNIDADIPGGSASIYAKIYYKISSNTSYSLLTTTSNWSISGSTGADSHFETIGSLAHNTYDFKVELYRAGTSTPIVSSSDPSSDADLDNENFELSSEDGLISIYGSYWTNIIDNDIDGRRQFGMLNVDVDVSTGSKSIRVLLLIRENGTTTWYSWRNSEYFTITGGSGSDFITFAVGNLATVDYEFRVDVYEQGSGVIKDSHEPADDPDLDDEPFELLGSDSWFIATSDTKWTLATDGDSDGYRSFGRLTFDIVNGYGGDISIQARVLYKSVTNGSTTYTVYYTTSPFTLSAAGWDDFWIAIGNPNPQLSMDTYNFEIQILYNSSIVSSNRRDTPLVDEGFEPVSSD
ncbi:MAG: choice-of-anchor H family protein [Calditrichaeota bacterium]|nr:choice-of-anchor H family protein [Calditrichota bacterium]